VCRAGHGFLIVALYVVLLFVASTQCHVPFHACVQAYAVLGLRFLLHLLREFPSQLGPLTPCALVPALGQMLSYCSSEVQVSCAAGRAELYCTDFTLLNSHTYDMLLLHISKGLAGRLLW
jgi:hypothetical protein